MIRVQMSMSNNFTKPYDHLNIFANSHLWISEEGAIYVRGPEAGVSAAPW